MMSLASQRAICEANRAGLYAQTLSAAFSLYLCLLFQVKSSEGCMLTELSYCYVGSLVQDLRSRNTGQDEVALEVCDQMSFQKRGQF